MLGRPGIVREIGDGGSAVVIDGSAGRGRRAAGFCAALLLLLSGMAIILALLRALESPHPTFTRLEFLGLTAAALAVAAVCGAGAARTARIMVRQRKQGLTATATITGARRPVDRRRGRVGLGSPRVLHRRPRSPGPRP